MNTRSYYKCIGLAKKSIDWLPMDTYERFCYNKKHRYAELEKYNWIDRTFNYKFNSDGFRCEEFTDRPGIMFLGCSFTLGIGLPVESIWPTLVANQLNLESINLGIGGGSTDTCFRMCFANLDKLLPKIVVYMEPAITRLELVTHNHINMLGISNDDSDIFLKKWAVDDNNAYFNSQKNRLAIEHMCQQKNIKFVYTTYRHLTSFGIGSLARDLSHYGEQSHAEFAEYLIEQI